MLYRLPLVPQESGYAGSTFSFFKHGRRGMSSSIPDFVILSLTLIPVGLTRLEIA